jgi:hypothetical protein
MKGDNEAQKRVVRMVDGILAIVAGVDIAEADTALTLAVTATICVTESDAAVRRQMAEGFTRQVREFIQREDMVEWIRASVRHVSFRSREQ